MPHGRILIVLSSKVSEVLPNLTFRWAMNKKLLLSLSNPFPVVHCCNPFSTVKMVSGATARRGDEGGKFDLVVAAYSLSSLPTHAAR